MKKNLMYLLAFLIFSALTPSYTQGQNTKLHKEFIDDNPNVFEFCGIEVTVFCDGSVDVIFDDDHGADIFRVYKGPDLIVDFNNFLYTTPNPTGTPVTGPVPEGFELNTSILSGAEVTATNNFFIFIDSDCGQETYNLSNVINDVCPPTIEYCGVEWTFNCDGTFSVDFEEGHGVNIYKAYVGAIKIVELNNFDDEEFNVPVSGIFEAGKCYEFVKEENGPSETLQFGNAVPVDANFYIFIDTDCGKATINFSRILEQYYSRYDDDVDDNIECIPPAPEDCSTTISSNENNKGSGRESLESSNNNISYLQNGNQAAESALIYPNPTTDLININLPNLEENFDIQVFSIEGKLLRFAQQNGGGTLEISMQNLDVGIYFVKINGTTFNQVERIKVVK
ncbi:MAG: T9SS type A sorting domain-containing protein [Saprospiraceae bacterium]